MFKSNMVLLGGVLAVGLAVGYLAAGNNSLSTGGANPGEKSIAYWIAAPMVGGMALKMAARWST